LWQDYYIPAIVLGIGLLWRLIHDLLITDHGMSHLIERTAIEVLIILPLVVLGSTAVAVILSTSFGTLSTAVLKLLALIIAPEIFGDLMELWLGPFAWTFPGIFLVAPVYFGMYYGGLAGFFDLDVTENSVTTSLLFVVNFPIRAAFVLFALPHIRALFP